METAKTKKVIAFMALLATVAGLASCSKNELYIYECGYGHEGECNAEPCYLSVSDVETEKYAATGAATEKSSFNIGDALGIWVKNSTYTSWYNNVEYSNLKLSKEANGWELSRYVLLTSDETGKEAGVIALYPYNAEMSDLTVALSVDDDTDYLYDKNNSAKKSAPSVSLTMKHIRAKIVVKISKGNYKGPGVISAGTVSATSFKTKGKFNLLDTSLNFDTSATQNIELSEGIIPDEGSFDNEWFVFPTTKTSTSKVSFNFTIDGICLSTISTESYSFETGKRYYFTLTMDVTGLKVTDEGSVSIDPWSNNEPEDDAQLTN